MKSENGRALVARLPDVDPDETRLGDLVRHRLSPKADGTSRKGVAPVGDDGYAALILARGKNQEVWIQNTAGEPMFRANQLGDDGKTVVSSIVQPLNVMEDLAWGQFVADVFAGQEIKWTED